MLSRFWQRIAGGGRRAGHAYSRRRLEAYLDGALPPAEAGVVRAHLDQCAGCRQELHREQRWIARLRAEPADITFLPPERAARIQQKLYQSMRRRIIMRNTGAFLQSTAALAALVLIVGLFIWWQRNGDWTAVTEPPPAETEAEAVTLTVAGAPSFQEMYEQLGQQFHEAHPLIQVQYVPLDSQTAALPMGEQAALADVLLLEGWPPPTEAAAAFLDLAPLMAADLGFEPGDFWPGIMAACQAAGVQVGVPFRGNASLIFFDKAAFDAAGLPYPAPGWSWADFQQAAQQLAVREGEQTTRYAFADAGNPLGLLAPLVDGVIAESGDTLDGPRLASQLAWYVSLAEQGIIAPPTESTAADHHNLINNRQAAMWLGSLFALSSTRARLGDDLGVVSFPAGPGRASNPVTAGCALISAGSAQRQAAWSWLDYLSRQPLFTAGTLPVAPARPSVAESSDYWATLPADTAVAVRSALEHGWYRRAEMPELAAVSEALTQALSGERSLVESLPTTVEIQPSAPPPPPVTPVAVATPRVTATPAATNRDVIIIQYYSSGGAHSQEAAAALARAFNESQDRYQVKVTSDLPRHDGSFLERMANAGDCINYGGAAGGPGSFYDEFRDLFYSLQPLLDNEPATFHEDFDPHWWERNQVDGELYGLPGPLQPYMVFYNRGLLSNLGLEPPSPDWTIEDFWALAEAATRRANGRQIYGFVPYELWPASLVRFVPQAQYFFDPDTQPPAPAFDDPAVIQTLSWLAAMVERGVMFPDDQFGARTSWDYDNALRMEQSRLIIQGQAAMWVELVNAYRPNWQIQIGTAPYPQTELLGPYSQWLMVSSFLISKRAADPAGCWEWLKFLTSQPDAFAGVPPRYSVRQSAEWRTIVGEQNAVAYEVALSRWQPTPEDWWVWSYSAWAWQYGAWWSDAVQDVFAGGDPATVLQQTQAQAERFHQCVSAFEEPENVQGRACAEEADPNFWQGRSPPTP
jgi:ABC-type glycerol-3-phosphate transport system substrate-binding protein